MKRTALILVSALLVVSCGIYSFTGTSIQPDVKTITIPYVEYKALRVNPSLAGDLTDALQEKFRKLTRLEQVDQDGDLELVVEVTGYDVKATAITAKLHSPTANTQRTMSTRVSAPMRTLMPRSRWKP